MNIDELKTIRENHTHELEQALKGEKTSFPFIINTIPEKPLVQDGQEFYILAIGGSVFIKARCTKEKGQIFIKKKEMGDKPSFNNVTEFYAFINENVPEDIEYLAINFAYPLAPVFRNGEILDGTLMFGTKENSFTGLVGKMVGESIEEHLMEKRMQKIRVSVANDTICTLLSGMSGVNNPDFLACGIVGTGINFAFFTDKLHPVNLEAANFDKFTQTKYGKMIDEVSQKPGGALFEKETSGGYLYEHFNLFCKEHNLEHHLESSKELDEFAQKCDIGEHGEACKFAAELLDRSAALVACQVAGIMALKKSDMNFIMTGSLFWKAYQFKETVTKYVKQLVPQHSVKFIFVDNCEIYGAAKLIA
jgi:hexokinase